MGVKGRTRWKAVLDRFIGTGLLVIVWNSRNKFFIKKIIIVNIFIHKLWILWKKRKNLILLGMK
jgi:hypothetical protein